MHRKKLASKKEMIIDVYNWKIFLSLYTNWIKHLQARIRENFFVLTIVNYLLNVTSLKYEHDIYPQLSPSFSFISLSIVKGQILSLPKELIFVR